ncbi:DUF421 domain-containing protein [Peribacillus kribbensis]|uniref:DUF421 domain-containing protein n=1 Tax=Peribacillus kribbensis TaxID=356658 RepID=UPI00041CF762|nr:DUF421 domain-containing protein [Peribacillus kribbensis]
MYGHLAIKLVIGYITLFGVTRLLGKKNIGQLNPMDFVSTLLLSEFLGNALYDQNVSILHVVFACFVWVLLILVCEYLSKKFYRFRRMTEGNPSIVIIRGTVDWNQLKRNRVDMQELLEMLRANEVFSLREVEYGILENNGSLSVMKRSLQDAPTRKDLNLPAKDKHFPVIVIENGVFSDLNLTRHSIDKGELRHELEERHVNLSQVSYAEYREGEDLYIRLKEK